MKWSGRNSANGGAAESGRRQAAQRDELVPAAVERYLRLKRREKLYAYGEARAEKLGIREMK
jgi:hypothetical protein